MALETSEMISSDAGVKDVANICIFVKSFNNLCQRCNKSVAMGTAMFMPPLPEVEWALESARVCVLMHLQKMRLGPFLCGNWAHRYEP